MPKSLQTDPIRQVELCDLQSYASGRPMRQQFHPYRVIAGFAQSPWIGPTRLAQAEQQDRQLLRNVCGSKPSTDTSAELTDA